MTTLAFSVDNSLFCIKFLFKYDECDSYELTCCMTALEPLLLSVQLKSRGLGWTKFLLGSEIGPHFDAKNSW